MGYRAARGVTSSKMAAKITAILDFSKKKKRENVI